MASMGFIDDWEEVDSPGDCTDEVCLADDVSVMELTI